LDGLAAGPHRPPRSPGHASRHVILTSGTTGKPKGAPREAPGLLEGIEPLVALVGAIPLRARQATVLATPMFHTWGFAHLLLGLALQSTLVVQRRFEPEATLALLEQHEATAMIAVPVMLQRMLALPDEVRARHRPRALRVVAISGSAIPASVAERFMDEFGDVVYNLYGSTEVAYATVATPADLRAAPGTAGRPLHGVTLRILDEGGAEVPRGETGRIFAGNALTFEGYSGGEDKERVGGLMATGDVGHLDEGGRLMIDGRDDDMIVSGGENVYPREVEECLLGHPGVADAAVVGVPDERYGQALVAHVVARNGGVDPEELRGYVKRELAGYKVPREVVLHDDLPRNETGKVLKTELSD
jgi:fatty-acyl-CoA synthase